MENFTFKTVNKDRPSISLEGLINPFELNKEEINQKFNSGKSSIVFFKDGYIHFDENSALSFLLRKSIVFINNHWWKSGIKKHDFHTVPENPWPEQACDTFSINVNCNDLFAWGVADAEELFYTDLELLYAHCLVDINYGSSIYCIKKRKMLPQKPVLDSIVKEGLWDLDLLNFINEKG